MLHPVLIVCEQKSMAKIQSPPVHPIGPLAACHTALAAPGPRPRVPLVPLVPLVPIHVKSSCLKTIHLRWEILGRAFRAS